MIDRAYAGPHHVQVNAARSSCRIAQWIADQGFVQVSVDGRGTPGRGRDRERAIRGDFAGPAPADHRAALTGAATLSRPPLLIHGTAADHVHFFRSPEIAEAFDRAGVAFEFQPLPGETHSVNDPAMQRQEYVRPVAFLRREPGVPGDAAPPRP